MLCDQLMKKVYVCSKHREVFDRKQMGGSMDHKVLFFLEQHENMGY